MSISYKKLNDGSWGLAGLGFAAVPSAGHTVTVVTKAGAMKAETIGHILSSGKSDDGSVWWIARKSESAAQPQRSSRTRSRRSMSGFYGGEHPWAHDEED